MHREQQSLINVAEHYVCNILQITTEDRLCNVANSVHVLREKMDDL